MGDKVLAAAALTLVVGVALWEGALALHAPAAAPTEGDYRAAAAVVRAGFTSGDLIACAPAWIGPLCRKELGDLMPPGMVGRPDGRAYGRIWEVSIRGERAEDATGLSPEFAEQHGAVKVSRYRQQPVGVLYDLAAHYLTMRVTQGPPAAGPAEAAAEIPCPFVGPLPPEDPAEDIQGGAGAGRGHPQRGEAGAFRCTASRVERRVMEIDYRPRYGIVVTVEPGRQTVLEFSGLPAGDGGGASLVLWFGLHDYYARKTESGPVDVEVDLDGRRTPVKVWPERGWQPVRVQREAGPGLLRVSVSARDARARNLGLAGQVRR